MTEEIVQINHGGFHPLETTEYRERGRCSVFIIPGNPRTVGIRTWKTNLAAI